MPSRTGTLHRTREPKLRRACRASPHVLASLIWIALALFSMPAMAAPAEPAQTAREYRMVGDATRMRIMLQFDREPELKWFLLKNPHRLVIDLDSTRFLVDPDALEPRGLVSNVRYGHVGEGQSRVIIEARGPFQVERIDVTRNEDGSGYRLVGDVVASSHEQFDAALREQIELTGSTALDKAGRLARQADEQDNRFVIALDPGHGGIDTGAEGVSGTIEKDLTLSFSNELKALLEASGRYRVIMTRDEDIFVRLDERVRIAREHGAKLFLSIHADTIRYKGLRGATVYTVADRASDEEAAAFAARENLADAAAGMEAETEASHVVDILADLMRRETQGFSVRFARSLLGALEDTTGLIKNPHRSAGFRVLRAPDVPSVLLELGYLSNKDDEAQFRDVEWRRKAAVSIKSAIDKFVAGQMGAGG